MKPTPRTDAEVKFLNGEYVFSKNFEYIHTDFARQLERELAIAKEDAEAAWKTARAADKARMDEMAKRDEVVALLKKCEKVMKLSGGGNGHAGTQNLFSLMLEVRKCLEKMENPK